MSAPQPGQGERIGHRQLGPARAGIIVGFTSWAVVSGVIATSTGHVDYLWPAVVPALLASLGFALVALHAIEPAMPGAPPAAGFGLRVAGCLCVGMGTLFLLAEALMAPLLQEVGFAEAVRATGGVLVLPREVSMALLAIGCVILGRALRRVVNKPELLASKCTPGK